MDNYISASEAFGKLYELKSSNQPITQDSIEEIISQLSIADKNATTILYTTGGEYNGDPSTKRYIGNTEAYDFIENQQFQSIIRDEIQAANNVTDPNVLDKMMQDYINGVEVYENFKPTGKMSNGTTGPWADVSRRFAAETVGDVVVCVGDIEAAASRIWWNTEMPSLLEKSGAKSINGVAIEDYRFLYNQLIENGADNPQDKISRMTGLVPSENVNPNYLDDVTIYFDESGKIIDIDSATLEFEAVDDFDSLDDFVRKESKYIWEVDDARFKGSYKSTSELLKSVNGNLDDMGRLVSSVIQYVDEDDCAERAMKVLESTKNKSVDDAIDILKSCNSDSYGAEKILTQTNGDVNSAKKVITAANGSVDSAIDMIDTTKDAEKAAKILIQTDGDVNSAKKVINAANGSVDNAIDMIETAKDVNKAEKLLSTVDGNINDVKKVIEATGGSIDDAIDILDRTRNANKSIDIINRVDGNIDDAINLLKAANNDSDGAIRVLKKTNNDPTRAVSLLNSAKGNASDVIRVIDAADGQTTYALHLLDKLDDADKAVNILKEVGGDGYSAERLIDAAKNDYDGALSILKKTKNAENAINLLENVGGNAKNAERLLKASNYQVEDALYVLEQADSDLNKAIKAFEKIGGSMDDVEIKSKYKLHVDDPNVMAFYRKAEYRIALGQNPSKVMVGELIDTTKTQFKMNNSLLTTDIKDLRLDDFLEFAKNELGISTGANAAKSAQSTRLKLTLTKTMRAGAIAANVATTAVQIYSTVKFVAGLADALEDGIMEPREVGEEAAAYIASSTCGWLTSELAAAFFTATLPLVGVSGPLGIAAIIVFSLAAGIAGSQFGDWIARELYQPSYDTVWGVMDYFGSDKIQLHVLEGTSDSDIMDFSDGRIKRGVMDYAVKYKLSVEGGKGDDIIKGYIYDDMLYGDEGNDTLYGGDGSDDLYGGEGNDTLYGGNGNDSIFGADGTDLIYGEDGSDTIFCGEGDDIAYGGDMRDKIWGGKGADRIYGEEGNDLLYGDENDDLIEGGSGNDLIYGDGDDEDGYSYFGGDDYISGGSGHDEIHAGGGNDVVFGEGGDDTIYADDVNDIDSVLGGDDSVSGGYGDDKIYGGAGEDKIWGDSGNDYLYGNDDDDILIGGTGKDHIYGGDDNDIIYGDDPEYENIGDKDYIYGDAGDDLIYGQTGDDLIEGGNGSDEIHGGNGNDYIYGNEGSDMLYGDNGNDHIYGGAHHDTLDGGAGDDYLYGGDGRDTYVFGRGYDNDTIFDKFDSNKVHFKNIVMDDITLKYETVDNEKNLVITVKDSGDTLTIRRFDETIDNFTFDFIDVKGRYKISDEDGLHFVKLPPEYGGSGSSDSSLLDSMRHDQSSQNSKEYNEAGKAQPPRDPLIMDANRDGKIDTISLDKGVFFDLDANGFAENTAWAGPNEGFLALDLDGNGKIENGRELFGDETYKTNGVKATSGFDALAQYDENHDDKIDKEDPVFEKLLVWTDSDSDGFTDDGELTSVKDAGIKSISVKYTETKGENDPNTGVKVTHKSEVKYEDGKTVEISEHWFDVNTVNTKDLHEFGDGSSMTGVDSFGSIMTLNNAIISDDTGTLKTLVEKFKHSDDIVEKRVLNKKILYFISGMTDVDPLSRGGNIDARDLGVIERFMDVPFVGVNGSNPNSTASVILKRVFSQFETMYYNLLDNETMTGSYFDLIEERTSNDGKKYLDYSIALEELSSTEADEHLVAEVAMFIRWYDALYGTSYYNEFSASLFEINPEYKAVIEKANANVIVGSDRADSLNGTNSSDVIRGENGDDTINAGTGNDYLYGGAGNDTLNGSSGDDQLYGEKGNDILNGGAGNDTYYFGKNHGNDVIRDTEGDNKLVFTGGISADDYNISIDAKLGFVLTHKETGETISMPDFLTNPLNYNFVFEGKSETVGPLGEREVIEGTNGDDYLEAGDGFNIFYGGDGNDTLAGGKDMDFMYGGDGDDLLLGRNGVNVLFGGNGNDTIYDGDDGSYLSGGDGDDFLYGGGGADVLDGGAGNDYLQGDHGGDTYIFGRGYDTDTINASSDLNTIIIHDYRASSMINTRNAHNDLIINFGSADSTDCLIVDHFFDYNSNRDFNFVFDDGTVLGQYDITAKYAPIYGTDGDDWLAIQNGDNGIIHGGAGNDGLSGGSGNDELYGEDGDDTLYGNDGNDILDGGTGNDTLCGGNGTDTYIFAKGYGNDTINEWGSEHSIVKLTDINSDEVTITDQWGSNLVVSINETEDTLIISNFKWGQATYSFEFADGAIASVNKDTWELEFSKLPDIPETSEDDLVQENADILSELYADENLMSDIITEPDSTVISDISDSVSVNEDSDEIADQTDIQVMILTENMSAFADEDNVFDNTDVLDSTDDMSMMNQLLVGSQVQ